MSGATPTSHDTGTATVVTRDGHSYRVEWEVPGSGRWPVVFGFGNSWWIDSEAYLRAGYAVVKSDPRDLQFHHDAQDSYDLLQWIDEQSWSNGQVAMSGISRGAATQWGAVKSAHPSLKAIFVVGISPEPWRRMYWDHGAIQLAHTMNGRAVFGNSQPEQWWYLPLIDMDLHFRGAENEPWRNYVRNASFNTYWEAIDLHGRYDIVAVPVYQSTGWYDNYPIGVLRAWQALENSGLVTENRVRIHSRGHRGDGREILESIRFFNLVLKGQDDGIGAQSKLQVHVQQADEWRGYESWPPEGVSAVSYYLHADGSLAISLPTGESWSGFTYDPNDPTPTLFTNTSKLDPHPDWISAGQGDISAVWARSDVATFESAQLLEDTEVIGTVTARVYAATNRRDTDWVARLVDIDSQGIVRNVADGIIRARFRSGIRSDPELITPGEVLPYDIELEGTAYRFSAGHKIGLIIASASFPMWDRNPNTGEPIGMTSEMLTADQEIHHGGNFPSRLILPVLQREVWEGASSQRE